MKPSFLIIGAQRSGTTSLYNYLIQHPCIVPASKKEIHYFDNLYHKSYYWYRAQFPLVFGEYCARVARRQTLITGEASPFYLYHPHVPARVRSRLPEVSLIVLLRNPIDRAYSAYRYNQKVGYENLSVSFAEAVRREEERIGEERERVRQDAGYYSLEYQMLSYLSRGVYVDQLARWMHFFPCQQFMVLGSEQFFAHPRAALNRVLAFLGVPGLELVEYPKHNATEDRQMDPDTRRLLAEFFRPHSERLCKLLGTDFGWDD